LQGATHNPDHALLFNPLLSLGEAWLPSFPFLKRGEGRGPQRRSSRLLKNAHLRCYPHPSSLRRTSKYASLLSISGALHLGIFEQSEKNDFFSKLLDQKQENEATYENEQREDDVGHALTFLRT